MSRHPVLTYTAARVLLFLGVLGLLYVAGARDLLLVGLALVISGLASFPLLSRQRDAMSASLFGSLSTRVRRARRSIDEAAAGEDAEDEARRRAVGDTP